MSSTTNKGKAFENHFKESAEKQGIFIHRLKDTDLSFNGNPVSSYTPSNKCDFFLFANIDNHKGNLFGIECKSTKYPSIGIQVNKDDPEKMIQWKQLESLRKLNTYDGTFAGFVLNFRDDEKNLDDTFYLSIEQMDVFLKETQKKSINKLDCSMRALKVENKLLRKNYNYNIVKMIEDIVKEK